MREARGCKVAKKAFLFYSIHLCLFAASRLCILRLIVRDLLRRPDDKKEPQIIKLHSARAAMDYHAALAYRTTMADSDGVLRSVRARWSYSLPDDLISSRARV